MDGGRRLRRDRLIFFAVLVDVPVPALITSAAVSMASISSFGS